MGHEKDFFERLASTALPGWDIKLQPHMEPGQMDLASYDVHIYVVDTSTGWTGAGSMQASGFAAAARLPADIGLSLGDVPDLAAKAITVLGGVQPEAWAPDLAQCIQLTAAALTGTLTFDQVRARRPVGQYHGGPPVTHMLALLLASAAVPVAPADTQPVSAATAQAPSPLFTAEVERAKRDVDAAIRTGERRPAELALRYIAVAHEDYKTARNPSTLRYDYRDSPPPKPFPSASPQEEHPGTPGMGKRRDPVEEPEIWGKWNEIPIE